MDFMERDRGFLKRQIEALNLTISEAADRRRILSTQRDTMEIRRELLNDELVDERELAALKERIEGESARIREAEEDREKLEQRLTHWNAIGSSWKPGMRNVTGLWNGSGRCQKAGKGPSPF